ncbi:hypothetical protein CVIRNUC_006882 [Coccomyxa viridis]|uniref:L domain-like protein n=1 Tax=Coccomyxa viridis TaxID=1274662 RepID=A0AAV1I8Z1_9CHLO|nr:hypothetical protein CVIRNUC_006882 [Coccomyxa viridis]
MVAKYTAAALLLLALAVNAQYTSYNPAGSATTGGYSSSSGGGSSGYGSSSGGGSTTSGSGLTAGGGNSGTTAGGATSNPLYPASTQAGSAGTGIGADGAAPSSGDAGTGIGVDGAAPAPAPAAGRPSATGTRTGGSSRSGAIAGSSGGGSSGSRSSGGYGGYSSFTPASAALGQAPRSSLSGSGTLPAQSNNPYSTNTGPSVVYVPGSRAAAPAAYYPPAPAPGPLQALGPLGSQAQTAAQNTSFGETQLSGVGPIYKKQDSLEPFFANLYGIPVPAGESDPDIFITLEVLNGDTSVGLYCNPGWGQYADVNANYPQPGYAVWQSDLSNDVDAIFISKNDRLYRPPYAREPNTTAYNNYIPYFICSVINMDAQRQVAYRLEADLINNQGNLTNLEQRALYNIFTNCCAGSATVCSDWKTRNAQQPGGGVFTNWCKFPGQICTANGTLLRLDMRGFNLQCPFPATDMAVFTSLTTLNLGRNPNMTGSALDVFSALANAKSLRHLNLYHDSGLTGPLVPPLSPLQGGLCQLARRSLSTLTADGISLTGGIPACLVNNGSSLVELHLGNNNFTGSIPNVVPPSSKLQVLTVYNNQLTGTIPSTIGNAKHLQNFDITNNAIFGTIPPSLGNITELKYAILKFNKLTGSIPSALGTAPNLETLDVKSNHLSVLPDEWVLGYPSVVNSSLVNVRTSFNNFSGSFPAALAQAPDLTFLVINNNTLSGPLPSNDSGVPANSTNFFPSLRAMNISHNAFTGTLPTAFGQAGVFNQKPLQFADGEILMHVFDVSYNQLSGVLPSFLDFTNVPEYVQRGIFIAGNNFTYSCGAQQSYINDICLSSAPAPSQLPPMGTSTSGSRTASSGLPSTNQTLPANNGSLPGQMQYPGGTYPGSQGSPPQNPSNPSTASASADGNPVDTQAHSKGGHHGLGGGAIAGIVIGVLLALALLGVVVGVLVTRRRRQVAGGGAQGGMKPQKSGGGGLGSVKNFGNSLKMGGSNKFERFNDGLEMSESTRRMEGFGSGR